MGLLSRALGSPELIGALIGGAGTALTGDEEDRVANAILGGALGLGTGMAGRKVAKGLLSRSAKAMPAGMSRDEAAIALRKAIASSGVKPTAMPPATVTDAIRDYDAALMSERMPKSPSIGRRISDAWGAVEGAGSRLENDLHGVWDAVDRVGTRALKDVWAPGLVAGTIGGLTLGANEVMGDRILNLHADERQRESALTEVGLPAGKLGVIALQAESNLPTTGEWDDDTLVALARKLTQASDGMPSAPSLSPERR